MSGRTPSGSAPPRAIPALTPEQLEEANNLKLDVNERGLKKMYATALSLMKSRNADDRKQYLASLQVDMMSVAFTMQKLETVSQVTCPTEQRDYEDELAQLQQAHEATQQEIIQLRQELIEAQEERANKLQYDALAKQVNRYPNREATSETLDSIQRQLSAIREESEGYRDIAARVQEGYTRAMEVLGGLQSTISSEIAEKERKAVETSAAGAGDEGDADAEAEGSEADAAEGEEGEGEQPEEGAATRDGSERRGSDGDDDEEEEGGVTEDPPTAPASLNPNAPAFQPSRSASSSGRGPFGKRGQGEDDEEGAVSSGSGRPAKRGGRRRY